MLSGYFFPFPVFRRIGFTQQMILSFMHVIRLNKGLPFVHTKVCDLRGSKIAPSQRRLRIESKDNWDVEVSSALCLFFLSFFNWFSNIFLSIYLSVEPFYMDINYSGNRREECKVYAAGFLHFSISSQFLWKQGKRGTFFTHLELCLFISNDFGIMFFVKALVWLQMVNIIESGKKDNENWKWQLGSELCLCNWNPLGDIDQNCVGVEVPLPSNKTANNVMSSQVLFLFPFWVYAHLVIIFLQDCKKSKWCYAKLLIISTEKKVDFPSPLNVGVSD